MNAVQKPVLVLASENTNKQREFQQILTQYEVVPMPNSIVMPPEDAEYFAAIARIKAQHVYRETRQATIADDSGLMVHVLDGRPGIYSARWAGEGATDADNRAKLLAELGEQTDRRAAFVCALAYVDDQGNHEVFQAYCTGIIGHTERGEYGFGYDSLFFPDALYDTSFAEASDDEKHALSHRGQAARLLADHLAHLSR